MAKTQMKALTPTGVAASESKNPAMRASNPEGARGAVFPASTSSPT